MKLALAALLFLVPFAARDEQQCSAQAECPTEVFADVGSGKVSGAIAQHSVDASGQLIKRITASAGRQTLAQITSHDTLDFSVDFQNSVLSTPAQYDSDENRQNKCRQQAQREGAHDNLRPLADLLDVPADH